MRTESLTVTSDDGLSLHVYHWSSDAPRTPRAVIHVSHGLAEHAARYARLAESLVEAGYEVYANDHRGHGKTAASETDLGFFGSKAGWRRVMDDLWLHLRTAKARHEGTPLVLLGHSMGSFFAQQMLFEHGDALAAAVLSGTAGKPPAIATAGRLLARMERLRLGERGRSTLLNGLSFDDFNKPFRPNRTKFDWLSRDDAEVDKYVDDPHCGFIATTQLFIDMLDALPMIADPVRQSAIPSALPIRLISGSEDPVGNRTRSVDQLRESYRAAGLTRVTHKYYPGARHEIFNETNRDEVVSDLIAWLDEVLPKRS